MLFFLFFLLGPNPVPRAFLEAQNKIPARPEDSEYEVSNMKAGVGRLEVFPTIWGHWAGGPGDSKEDVKWLDEQLGVFFAENDLDKLRT